MLLAALSTGHKVGLGVVAGAFILFALTSSFVLPRKRPDFPGKDGLSVFIVLSFAFFFAMLTAVIVFGRESEAKGAEAPSSAPAAAPIPVRETEFKIALPAAKVPAGKVTLTVQNAGKIQHDLVVSGPGVTGAAKTPLINAGQSAKLTVTLAAGSYTLYCSVPGHRAAGMVAKLTVG